MVRKIEIISRVLIVFFICSCSNHSSNCEQGQINIGLVKTSKVSLFDFCNDLQIMQLEANDEGMISEGSIVSLAFVDSSLFILTKNSLTIKHFSLFDGKYIESINKHGRGHGEYPMASDMIYNQYSHTLDVLNPMGIIYKYQIDKDYKCVEVIDFSETNSATHYFAAISDTKYLLYSLSADSTVYLYDKNTEILSPVAFDMPTWIRGTSFHPGGNPFFFYEGEVRLFSRLDGSIYGFDENTNKLYTIQRWDFGEYNFDVNTLDSNQSFEYYVKIYKRMSYKYPSAFNIFENQGKYYASFRFNGRTNINNFVYDTHNNSCLVFNKTSEGISLFLKYYYDGAIYSTIDPENAFMFVNQDVVSDKNSLYLLQNLTDDSNLLILKYNMK